MKKNNLLILIEIIAVLLIAVIFSFISKKPSIEPGKPIQGEVRGVIDKNSVIVPKTENREIRVEDLEELLNEL